MITETILDHFRQLGFEVTVRRLGSAIEMHAVPLNGKGPRQVVRCGDGDGTVAELRCACLLARSVGVEFDPK